MPRIARLQEVADRLPFLAERHEQRHARRQRIEGRDQILGGDPGVVKLTVDLDRVRRRAH